MPNSKAPIDLLYLIILQVVQVHLIALTANADVKDVVRVVLLKSNFIAAPSLEETTDFNVKRMQPTVN